MPPWPANEFMIYRLHVSNFSYILQSMHYGEKWYFLFPLDSNNHPKYLEHNLETLNRQKKRQSEKSIKMKNLGFSSLPHVFTGHFLSRYIHTYSRSLNISALHSTKKVLNCTVQMLKYKICTICKFVCISNAILKCICILFRTMQRPIVCTC